MQHVCHLSRFGDHYEWNKVTSCIHNILSGQRWIEHYGEMAIKNVNSDVCQCKVTFVKVSYVTFIVNFSASAVSEKADQTNVPSRDCLCRVSFLLEY